MFVFAIFFSYFFVLVYLLMTNHHILNCISKQKRLETIDFSLVSKRFYYNNIWIISSASDTSYIDFTYLYIASNIIETDVAPAS